MSGPRLTFYTKPDCCLCETALAELEIAGREAEFDWIEVNILDDIEAYQRFKHDIPVLMYGERILFRHEIAAAELIQRLAEFRE